MEKKKKVIIVGAGISGMTAGIYLLDNGFDVEIYEKHHIVGGQCTGWNRSGVYIDGCAHWIVGTNKHSDLYPLWEHVGAFNQDTPIHETEYFCKYDINGNIVTFYADLNRLERELLRVAPEDKKQIGYFIKGIKLYQSVKIPTKKPTDMMNIFELIKFGFPMLKMVPRLLSYMHTSVKQYVTRFKSPILREVFLKFMDPHYNVHSMFYIMQALSKGDAGMVEGGSRNFSFNIKDRFESLGGVIYTDSEIDHILVANDKAYGIALKKGGEEYADYVIASGDAHHTMYELLEGRYPDKYFDTRFNDRHANPLNSAILVSYRTNIDMSNKPKMICFDIDPIDVAGTRISNVVVRNHSFDRTVNADRSTFTVLITTDDSVFDYYQAMSREEYKIAKRELGERIRKEIVKYGEFDDSDITLIDVATPLTYERYTNAYRGSYMSFITTRHVKGLMRVGLVKNLKNFALAGQWIMPPGGLPIALFSGKHAAIRICKMDKRKFIDLDKDNKVKHSLKEIVEVYGKKPAKI